MNDKEINWLNQLAALDAILQADKKRIHEENIKALQEAGPESMDTPAWTDYRRALFGAVQEHHERTREAKINRS